MAALGERRPAADGESYAEAGEGSELLERDGAEHRESLAKLIWVETTAASRPDLHG